MRMCMQMYIYMYRYIYICLCGYIVLLFSYYGFVVCIYIAKLIINIS